MDYYTKYLKYKQKYFNLKNKLYGGVITKQQYLALPDETKALYTYDHSEGSQWDEPIYYILKTPEDILKILKEQEKEREKAELYRRHQAYIQNQLGFKI